MQISVNLQSGRFEKKSPNWGGDFYMEILVNLQSGRFEKKSPNWGGGISACRFQSICRVVDLRKNLQNGGEFLHADFSQSAEWQI